MAPNAAKTRWRSARSSTRTSAAPRSPRRTSCRRTSSSTVCSGSRGSTPIRSRRAKGQCWGDEVGILNACQPPLQRDYAMPRIDINGLELVRQRHPRQRQHRLGVRLPRPAVAVGDERRLEQGRAQRQVRRRRAPAAHEPLRNHRAELQLHGRRNGAQRRTPRRTCSTGTPISCSACRSRGTPRSRIRCSTKTTAATSSPPRCGRGNTASTSAISFS